MADSPQGLIDTGAILALLDRKDRWHERCTDAFSRLRLPLATTTAVLTEVFHLLSRSTEAPVVWGFVRSGAVKVVPIGEQDLPQLEILMARYQDRPMDFADATLVHVARKANLTTVFTVDHDDFETYRIEGRQKFRIVPSR
jgi:predicted nucleic acid-binding protein